MSSTVLLVVNDSSFLENLANNFNRFRASIIMARNKHEALEACSDKEVDLALLDIRQQGHDAMQVLTRLKKKQPGAEVILLSDPANIAFAMEGMRQGASDDITVPFEVGSFRKTIRAALRRRKTHLQASRKRSMLKYFEDTMVAATYAQAGDFETAQNVLSDADRQEYID